MRLKAKLLLAGDSSLPDWFRELESLLEEIPHVESVHYNFQHDTGRMFFEVDFEDDYLTENHGLNTETGEVDYVPMQLRLDTQTLELEEVFFQSQVPEWASESRKAVVEVILDWILVMGFKPNFNNWKKASPNFCDDLPAESWYRRLCEVIARKISDVVDGNVNPQLYGQECVFMALLPGMQYSKRILTFNLQSDGVTILADVNYWPPDEIIEDICDLLITERFTYEGTDVGKFTNLRGKFPEDPY